MMQARALRRNGRKRPFPRGKHAAAAFFARDFTALEALCISRAVLR
jgi:hypothetical protein